MSTRATRHANKDRGAALLLAIGTVVMLGAIGAGLAAAASSSLQNRTTLEEVRDREYAADGAIEEAISQVRGLSCASGSGSRVDASMNSVTIRVDWTTDCSHGVSTSDTSNATPYPQRNVTFWACPNTGATCVGSSTTVIRAEVNFEPASGPVSKTSVQSWSVRR